jgi:hypothetical protein
VPDVFETDAGEYPNLARIFVIAREHDCDWISFDRDADELEGLPTFDW